MLKLLTMAIVAYADSRNNQIVDSHLIGFCGFDFWEMEIYIIEGSKMGNGIRG